MDIGYLVLISLIFAILVLMIYDVCNCNNIAMYHILTAILLILASCVIVITTNRSDSIPKPNTHPAGEKSDSLASLTALRLPDVYNVKVNTSDVKPILDKTRDFLIIIADEPNDCMKAKLEYLYEHENIFIVLHNIKRLQFNILEHELVPTVRIMDEEESKEFIDK